MRRVSIQSLRRGWFGGVEGNLDLAFLENWNKKCFVFPSTQTDAYPSLPFIAIVIFVFHPPALCFASTPSSSISTAKIMAENLDAVTASMEAISVSPRTDDNQSEVRYERKMGNSELSYYLPSRANGVNDM